jgi:hypothetical protein
MSNKKLILSIDGIAATLSQFTTYDRTPQNTGETEYAIIGTPTDSGLAYEPKHSWNVSALTTLTDWHAIQLIFAKSDRLRRQQGNYRITVDDLIQPFAEEGARTRAVATGGVVTNVPGGVSYPAKFYVRMFDLKSQKSGSGKYPYTVSFTLKELDKVIA